jgi:formylglycine-generating enzyme required for sulfatase activity
MALPRRRAHASLLALALLAAAAPAARGGDGDAPAATESPPPLRFLGLNRQGHEEWWRAKDGAVVIRVPGGPYLRRPYEGTVAVEEPSPVEVASFLVDKHEVTNERFARFLREAAPADADRLLRAGVPGIERGPGGWRAAPGLEQHPVTAATGHGALAYAAWIGGSIPTADQWMKAAGGPEGRLYPWGDSPVDAARANGGRPGGSGLEPVGSRPAGASPYGCLDMAGNAYDRVRTRVRGGEERAEILPVMLKGGSWLSSHPLNLRVLDLCMQGMDGAERSVGFRCAMADPEPDRPSRRAGEAPVLRIARDWDAAIAEARSRKVPVFLSLLHDTCGQCDRTIAQVYRDPRFVAYCNEHLVVVLGHQPWDADDDPHPGRTDGTCTVHAGVTCREHEELYRRGLAVVRRFRTSPGNFLLDPFRTGEGQEGKPLLLPESAIPKGGDSVDPYLEAFDRARALLVTPDSRTPPEPR